MASVDNLIPALLLVTFLGAVGGGAIMTFLVSRWKAQLPVPATPSTRGIRNTELSLIAHLLPQPRTWLAVRTRDLRAVQKALRLNNAEPCTWSEGLSSDEKLFIAPPVGDWVLVLGSGLPDPADDVDVCFRFLTGLSAQLGHVQFFQANHALGHHAWAQIDGGRVKRGYAWAGQTLWNEGAKTRAEQEFGLKCFQYFESPDQTFDSSEIFSTNTERVSALAARWSFDPASVDELVLQDAYGIAGKAPRLY